MDFPFRKYFFLLILFLSHGIIFAQVRWQRLHVVKDNIACLYGLKNDSGRWVVPAQYTTLDEKNYNVFIAMNGNKYGVLDQKGKLVIPVNYDFINAVGYGQSSCFILGNNKKYGVANMNGDTIIPFEFDFIKTLSERSSFYFVVSEKKFSGIINWQGKTLLQTEYTWITESECTYGYFFGNNNGVGYGDSTGIKIQPIYSNIQSIMCGVYFRVANYSSPTGMGIIGINGDTLLPIIYSDVWLDAIVKGNKVTNKRYIVELKNTYGVFDSVFHPIIPVGLKLLPRNHTNYGYYQNGFSFTANDTIPGKRDQKWGLITGNEIWVTKQDYDSIIIPGYPAPFNSYQYIVKQNGKFGTMNSKGKIIIPIIYDSLREVSDNDELIINFVSRSDATYYFIGKKNGKRGITNSKGEIWVPYIYDTIIEQFGKMFFTNSTNALYFQFGEKTYNGNIASESFPLNYFFKINDSLLVYKTATRFSYYGYYFSFVESTTNGKKILLPYYSRIFDDPNNEKLIDVILCNENYDYYSQRRTCDTLTFDKTGKPIVNPLKGKEIVGYFKGNLIFRNSEKKLGIISNDGKTILPPIYVGLQPASFDNKNYIWLKFQPDTSCPFYQNKFDDCACGWTLCDSLAHPLCKTTFDYPFMFVTNPQPVFVNGKVGLFDVTNHLFLIPPRYVDMISIYGNPYDDYNAKYYFSSHSHPGENKNLFYVIRENNEFGIMDSTGKWVSDSTYTEMISMPRRNHLLCNGGNANSFYDKRELITGSSGRMIMDDKGLMTTDSALIDSIIAQSFIMKDFQYGYYFVGDGGGGDNTPEFMKQGPSITGIPIGRYLGESKWIDSANEIAMQFSLEILMTKYRYLFVSTPRSYYFKCDCITSKINTRSNANYVNLVYHDNTSWEARHPYGQFSGKAGITFLSTQGFSLLMSFSPDSSLAARNKNRPFYLNFRKTAGGFVPCTLDSIFCPDVNYDFVLNELILQAISKRDDLNLDCNNPQSYFTLTQGRFCFSKEGLVFFIDNNNNKYQHGIQFSVTIPWNEIQPYSRPGGIVDDFIGNSLGEHCKLPLDTTVIDFKFQNYFRIADFTQSYFLQKEKVMKYSYFIDENDKIIGIRFCCEGNIVYDTYFKAKKVKNIKQFMNMNESENLKSIPKKLLKRKIKRMICIKNFPCT